MQYREDELEALIVGVRRAFPDASLYIDSYLERLGFPPNSDAYSIMMEAFSKFVTDAIRRKDEQLVISCFCFMDTKLEFASSAEKACIDVCFVEPLMWDIADIDTKRWGWSVLPESLKELYVKFWGKPVF